MKVIVKKPDHEDFDIEICGDIKDAKMLRRIKEAVNKFGRCKVILNEGREK